MITNYSLKGIRKEISLKTTKEELIKYIEDINTSKGLSKKNVKLTLDKINKLLNKIDKGKSKVLFNNNLQYFTQDTITPSVAEKIISDFLNKYNINFSREVYFKDLVSPKGGYYRYDFYLPDYNLIIEYDGKKWHKDKTRDDIKNKYCLDNNINIVRFSSKHYYQLDKHIKRVLKIK